MSKLERDFQAQLIKDLRVMFQGCIILKNDASYLQGVPDLIVLFDDKWAMLECKRARPTKESDFQPNQPYYVKRMNEMSFASFIYPENREQVLNGLQRTFLS